MKKGKLLLTTIMVVLCCIDMIAQPRNESDALEIAKKFFLTDPTIRRAGLENNAALKLVSPEAIGQKIFQRPAFTRSSSSTEIGFYVFNDELNKRFVIVSGDERQYEVLGSSDNGSFHVDNIPCGLTTFLIQYAEEYQYIQNNEYTTSEEIPNNRRASSVSPLIQTTWNQSPVYNDLCPMVRGEKCVAGCVATALAQVMNYFQYPEKGEGIVTRIPGRNKLSQESLDLSSKSFDWASLRNARTITSSTSSAGKAVAYLIKACGYALKMDYGTSAQGSSSSTSYIPSVLVDNFGYSSDVVFAYLSRNSQTVWENAIKGELSLGHPIIYRGEGAAGGHSFILDGYNASSGKYHFNWGWGGQNDGYFLLSSLKPGKNNFSSKQGMAIYISPAPKETISKPIINLDKDFDKMTISCATDGVTFYYSFTPQDNASTASYQPYYTSQKISIKCNGTFRAYVEKKGKRIEADAKKVDWFNVEKPEFYPDGNKITIKCPSATTIYYTKDGKTPPTKSSIKYTSPITVINGTTIMAIGVKENHNNSAVAKYEYKDEIRTTYNFTNTAGRISEQINNASKMKAISLTIAGKLNGTDIKFIREMSEYGALERLDMKNASIINGGDSYYASYVTEKDIIGDAMFTDLPKLVSVVLPSNIVEIRDRAFSGCIGLTKIEIPSTCKKIGTRAFKETAITSLAIPEKVNEISWGIVQSCKSLKNLSVASGNRKYDSRDNCNAIIETSRNQIVAGCTNTIIPNSVTDIEMYAFCSSPSKLTIPGNCEHIWNWAFDDNNSLEEVTIEEGVRYLSRSVFSNCTNLKTVTLPASVYCISENSFENCSNLRTFKTYNETPIEIDESVFAGSNIRYATLYVPYGCKAKYEVAKGWRDFRNIIEMYQVVNSIAELKALPYHSQATLNLKDAQVTFVSSHSKYSDYVYLRDYSGSYCLYGSNIIENLGIRTGDYISGPIPLKVWTYWGAVYESELDTEKITKGINRMVQPTEVSTELLGMENGFDLISLKELELSGGNDLLYVNLPDHYLFAAPEEGIDAVQYEEILAATKNKDLSGRKYNLTGIFICTDYGWSIKLISPIEEVSSPSGINIIKDLPSNSNNDCYFDLQGRRIENPTAKGIYISKGKKFMLK